jgi:hypothetical protein
MRNSEKKFEQRLLARIRDAKKNLCGTRIFIDQNDDRYYCVLLRRLRVLLDEHSMANTLVTGCVQKKFTCSR